MISKGVDTVAVPNLIGQTRSEATATLNAAGLQLGGVTQEPAAQEAGTVIRSDPGTGTEIVERNSQVNLVLSAGPTPSPTPQPTPPPRTATDAAAHANAWAGSDAVGHPSVHPGFSASIPRHRQPLLTQEVMPHR